PGRRHDHDARVDRALRGAGQRISQERLGDARTNRKVDYAYVVLRTVADGPVERRDHVADVSGSIRVEHLETDQMRAWRNARTCAGGVEAVARHDAGDVSTVPEVIVWSGLAIDEIDEAHDALSTHDPHARIGSLIAQIVVPGGDT